MCIIRLVNKDKRIPVLLLVPVCNRDHVQLTIQSGTRTLQGTNSDFTKWSNKGQVAMAMPCPQRDENCRARNLIV